jgi:hypothetical protein
VRAKFRALGAIQGGASRSWGATREEREAAERQLRGGGAVEDREAARRVLDEWEQFGDQVARIERPLFLSACALALAWIALGIAGDRTIFVWAGGVLLATEALFGVRHLALRRRVTRSIEATRKLHSF